MAPKRKAGEVATSSAAAGKSKKLTIAAASTVTIDLKKHDGDWVMSVLKVPALTKLRTDGLLPPSDQLDVRVPSSKEVLLEPRANEHVLFVESVHRGLSFPLHDFVRGLLYAYGVHIHDFTPNGILHIALWKAIFKVRPNKCGGRTFPIGG